MGRWLLIKALFFLVLLVGFVACKGEEEELRERINMYWQYRISGNLTEAYKFEYPLLRKKLDLNRYISSRANPLVSYKKAEILEVKKEGGEVYRVKMRFTIEFIPPGGEGLVTPPPVVREEKWIKVGGEWFHVPAS